MSRTFPSLARPALAVLIAALPAPGSALSQVPLRAAAGSTAAPPVAAPPAAAAAAAEDPKAVFAEAQKAYQLGRFQEAIAKYERVFELTNHPSLLFNLAQCHRQLDNYERAAFFYQRYLATAQAPIPNGQLARDLGAEMATKRDAAKKAEEEKARQAVLIQAPPPEVKTTPLTKQWWLWVAIGAGVVAAGTVTAIAVGSANAPPPATTLGSIQF